MNKLKEGLKYLLDKYGFSISKVTDYFTTVRIQTAIDSKKGSTKEHSLRNFRVLKKGLTFFGEIIIEGETNAEIEERKALIVLAIKNMRQLGTSRTRGLGLIDCIVKDDKGNRLDKGLTTYLEILKEGEV